MICINFGHPLTAEQVQQIESLCGILCDRVVDVTCLIEENEVIGPQISALADGVGLTIEQWQTLELIIVPPALHIAAATLMAELHGRIGHFPSLVRFRPIESHMTVRFEAVEIVSLNEIRRKARKTRNQVSDRLCQNIS